VRKRREAAVAELAGATYLGAGPIWATPSKPDAGEPIGVEGLRDVCLSVSIPVVAIGGIEPANAAECIRAGAAGVAVIRAIAQIEALRSVVDEAL
jgi:thiamine-phosphate pyrophosphorylase